jgi:K+-sensing histidine kinase KdpD
VPPDREVVETEVGILYAEVISMKATLESNTVLHHDLKSPIAAIEGYARLLLHSAAGDLSPRQRSYVEGILSACRIQSHLLDNMRLAERLENDAVEPSTERGRMPEILERVSRDLERAFQAKGARVVTEAKETELAQGAEIMEKIVANLLLAALYTADAGSEIALKAEHQDGEIQITLAAPGASGPGLGGGLALMETWTRQLGGTCEFAPGRLSVRLPDGVFLA